MKTKILFLITALILFLGAGCGKNETIRNNVKKNINEYLALGASDFKKGNYENARIYMEEALRQAYIIDSTESVVYVLQALADVSMKLENYQAASNYLFKAFMLADSEKIKKYDFDLYFKMGKYLDRTATNNQGYEAAMTNYQLALKRAQNDGERASAYNSMGITRRKQNRLDEALQLIEKSRALNQGLQDFDSLGDNYYSLGEIYFLKSGYDRALNYFLEALKYDKIAENASGIMQDLERIGMIKAQQGKNAEALNYYRRAQDVARGKNDEAGRKRLEERIKEVIPK